jgi:hypothetical protein
VSHSPVGWRSAAAAKPVSKNVAAQIAEIERMMSLKQFAIQFTTNWSIIDRFRRHFDQSLKRGGGRKTIEPSASPDLLVR